MTSSTGERMLVFAPHCDDAEFGIGAYMARAREENIGVFRVVVACTGDYLRADGRRVTSRERELESLAALEHLGVQSLTHPGWMIENRGREARYDNIVQLIAQEIESWQPTEVFVCLPSFNQDHRVLHDAVITAMRPGQHPGVKHLWCYEYPGTNVIGAERPGYGRAYLEVKQHHLNAKMQALNMHKSQFEGRKVAVDPTASLYMMQQRGSEVGVRYAECVYLAREVFRCL